MQAPALQAKCARCSTESEEDAPQRGPVQARCTRCDTPLEQEPAAEEPEVQRMCSTCAGSAQAEPPQPARAEEAGLAGARDSLSGASSPLPHLDRIQQAFGPHDVTAVRTQSGGRAAEAASRMGAQAFTTGGRIGFLGSPDLRLAAHEAAHVIQQRGGELRLRGGVGAPGDEYEQHADRVAEAVARGESAVPLLDRVAVHGSSAASTAASPIQHQLIANAVRIVEPDPAPRAPAASRADGEPAADPAARPRARAQTDERKEGGSALERAEGAEPGGKAAPDPAAAGTPSAEQPAAAGARADQAPASAQPGTAAGTPAQSAGEPACKGGPGATCYKEPIEEPAEEPEEQPQDPPPTQAQEQMRGDTPEVPEPDVCPVEQALAAQAPAAGTESAPAGVAATAGAADAKPAAAATPQSGARPESEGQAAAASGETSAPAAASEEAEPVAALSPFAQLEQQRDAAVLAYGASSSTLADAESGVQRLREGVRFAAGASEGDAEAARRDEASRRASAFFGGVAEQLDAALAFAADRVPHQLGAQAELWKSQLDKTLESRKAALSERIQKARDRLRGQAAITKLHIQQQAAAFAVDAQQQQQAAVALLQATHRETLSQVDAHETETLERVNTTYANGRAAHEKAGETIGDEASQRGEQFASEYERCKIHRADSFWAGHLTDRRAEAQQNAAREVAKGYKKSLIESAQKRAREVSKAGRKADRCAVIAAARSARQTLDQQLGNLTIALEAACATAVRQANATRDGLLGAVDAALHKTLTQLDRQEHDQRQAADDSSYTQALLQEQSAHGAAAAIQRQVADAAGLVQSALTSVQERFAASSAPDLDELDRALAQVTGSIGSALDGLLSGAESGAAAAEAQLAAAGQQGLAGLAELAASSEQLASTTESSAASSLASQEAGAVQIFRELGSGFARQMHESAESGGTALRKAVAGLRQASTKLLEQSEKSLKDSVADLEKALRESKAGMECEVPKRANEAAAKEAPAWKKALAIVLVILVIVLVIVVTVVSFGSATLLSAIVIGAVIGAVTSGMLQVAQNLWTNQKWSKGLGRAVLVGAVTGAIGGGVGFGIGHALRTAATVFKIGGALGTAVGLDVATQYVMGGFSFKDFSWKSLGITVLVTLMTLGIGARFGRSAAARSSQKPTGKSGKGTTTQSTETSSTQTGETTTNQTHETTTNQTHETTTNQTGETTTNQTGESTPAKTETTKPASETVTPEKVETSKPASETTTNQTGESTPAKTETTKPASETAAPEKVETSKPASETAAPEKVETTKPASETAAPEHSETKPPAADAETKGPAPETAAPPQEVGPSPRELEQIARAQKELPGELQKRGLVDDPAFANMDPQTQVKVNRALQGDPLKVSASAQEHAQRWALEGSGGNPREFANRYEYAREKFNNVRKDLTKQFTGQENAKAKVNEAASKEVTPEKLTESFRQGVTSSKELGPGQRLEGLKPGTPPEDIAQGVKKLDRIAFESEGAEVYHAEKHKAELPKDLPYTGDPVKDYAAAAMDTIKNGQVVVSEPASGGSTRVVIRKSYGNPPSVLEAILYVKPDGKVTLASYGAQKFKP